jgi:protein-serine/threonine kinase
MLAGYLPFDDDPANPEGDNINLLYKYIVSTPLTFPEYVTPHARDLLRRILVPDPRKRADLFEVARHSWLSEYSHVVGFITSTTTTSKDVATTTVASEEEESVPMLGRSSSVREASKASKQPAPGELGRKHGHVDPEAEAHPKPSKDNKRRTVQVEYVAPRSQTQRGETSAPVAQAPEVSSSRSRARAGSTGPTEVRSAQPTTRRQVSTEKPLPQDPPGAQYSQGRRPSSSRQQGMPPPTRPGRGEVPRSASETNYLAAHAPPPVSIARPTTGGSMTSTGSRSGSLALRDRGSYSQPAPPSVAGTNAQGRMAQPKNGSTGYSISAPVLDSDQAEFGLTHTNSNNRVPEKFARVAGFPEGSSAPPDKGHKRSNTIGGIFSRTNSIFTKRNAEQQDKPEKAKKYPPVSMSGAVAHQDSPRQSMDSRRSISFGFGKKRSGSITGSQTTLQDKPRRFSLLPASFSLKAIGIGKDYGTTGAPPGGYDDYNRDAYTPPPQTARTADSRNISGATATQPYTSDGVYNRNLDSPRQERRGGSTSSPVQARYNSQTVSNPRSGPNQEFLPPMNFHHGESALNTESESSLGDTIQARRAVYPDGFSSYNDGPRRQTTGPSRANPRGVLQKNNRKFTEAYEQEANNGYGPTHSDHAGSSGAARKVMDFFRRRGRDRGQ